MTTKQIIIDKPGIYEILEARYHEDPIIEPSLSSSIAKVMLTASPRHVQTKHPRLGGATPDQKQRQDWDIGSAVHSILLEGKDKIVTIEHNDYRKDAAKEARDAAYADNKIPLLAKQRTEVFAMVAAAHAQLKGHEEAAGVFSAGKPEQTLVWQEGDVWLRARLDWLREGPIPIWDYKTTTDANPDVWVRRLFDLGFDVQVGFYRRGVRALLGIENPEFRFIVQETSAPYALSVVGLTPSTIELADMKAAMAIERWRWCITNDRWPGYPRETAYIEAPPWRAAEFEEAKERERWASEHDESMFERMNDWQAPLEKVTP